ncbi:MAG: hypothetical protein M3Q75_04700 [Gemmatimonadota bacterium]|nr:hypothetical protein [Gemmatimonadota bacterium]
MTGLVLTGLDGSNPLGFLAALGTLNVLADSGKCETRPRIVWRNLGYWRPELEGCSDREQLIEAILADLKTWNDEAAIQLEYGDGERDLKPPPEEFRAFLERLVETASPQSRRSVDFAAAFATDVATDNGGKTKPTALHFTAGQQKFLAQVQGLRDGVTREDLEEALYGPWQYARTLPVLKWDATMTRDYALRAGDPSKEKVLGVPGADWLAFRGLSFLRTAPRGTEIATTGCSGGWKTGGFRWPLWTVWLGRAELQTVLTLSFQGQDERTRRARGIGVVYESRIRRSDQGGYGSFSPSEPL